MNIYTYKTYIHTRMYVSIWSTYVCISPGELFLREETR